MELERVIAVLKKALEKTQAENEQMKKGPGYVATEQMNALQKENQSLKVSNNFLPFLFYLLRSLILLLILN